MTAARTLTRTALDVSLRAALAPWATLGRVARFGGDRTSPIEVAVGHIDAAVRELAGRALSDDELLADAARRRAAAENRSLAMDLHQEAEAREAEAAERRRRREEQADEARDAAEAEAEQQHEAAAARAQKRKAAVKKAARSRKQAVRKAAARSRAVQDEAKRDARLEELDEQERALDAEEQAVARKARASRLKQAADAVHDAR